ncbi:B12-binding domain-containing radical SAM protein [candidate division CSSED10-310 bacterium]|uniref:B12-binding domain-containing radical SAM protein n=1 Tax=candidate division CSSED10-310 bacterium TaxID=2855610 RepID=A0ABV6YS07_UNCC1
MKLLLVEITCPDIRAFGVRSLASFVKTAGHTVNILFLPPFFEQLRPESGTVHLYPDRIITDFLKLSKQFDLVGISFLTYYFDRAVQLTQSIHDKLDIAVIWGGIHATTRPEECLQHADMVCLGEGEEALVELLDTLERDGDIKAIKNICSRHKGQIFTNPVRPLIKDINSLPFPDYDLKTHYAYSIFDDAIVPLNDRLMKFFSEAGPLSQLGTYYQYKTMASRGCPHHCAFCCNSIYREMYRHEKYLRWRSNEMLFQEIESALQAVPYFNSIMFFDDSFFAMPNKVMKNFTAEYKERIGLPFATQSSPQTTNAQKLDYLTDAGMVYLEMGIQTGSDRINSMYKRKQTQAQVLQAAQAINAVTGKILPPDYHLILDNNWETDADVLETLDLVLRLPRPFGLKPSSLVLYPGTELFRIAQEEGLITDEKEDVYRKAFGAPKSTYLNLLILMVNYSFIPLGLVRFLKRPFFLKHFNKNSWHPLFSAVRTVIHFTDRARRKIKKLTKRRGR